MQTHTKWTRLLASTQKAKGNQESTTNDGYHTTGHHWPCQWMFHFWQHASCCYYVLYRCNFLLLRLYDMVPTRTSTTWLLPMGWRTSDAWRSRWMRLVDDLAKMGAIKRLLDKNGCPVITNTVLLVSGICQFYCFVLFCYDWLFLIQAPLEWLLFYIPLFPRFLFEKHVCLSVWWDMLQCINIKQIDRIIGIILIRLICNEYLMWEIFRQGHVFESGTTWLCDEVTQDIKI